MRIVAFLSAPFPVAPRPHSYNDRALPVFSVGRGGAFADAVLGLDFGRSRYGSAASSVEIDALENIPGA